MHIVCFNGPPRSGKDTMAKLLIEHMESQGVSVPIIEVSLSTPLRRIAYAMTGYTGPIAGKEYEAFKVKWFPAFNRTGRQLMIDISESFMKPIYGQAIMAKMLLDFLGGFTGIVLVRDSGFQIEVQHFLTKVKEEKIYVAQVGRANCDYTNDSREPVTHFFMGQYPNNGTLEDLAVEAGRLYGRLVNQMGWKL